MAKRFGSLVTEYATLKGDIEMTSKKIVFHLPGKHHIQLVRAGILILGDSLQPICVRLSSISWTETTTEIECEKGGDLKSLLDHSIRPRLVDFSYQYPLNEEMLNSFVKQGVLKRTIIDNVLVCPSCESLATFRPGCPNCGTSHYVRDELIHHFFCGHIDFSYNFLDEDVVTCKKCKRSDLIINSDYDVTSGMCRCTQCDWKGNEAKMVGDCLACDTRFLLTESKQKYLWEYKLECLTGYPDSM